MRSDILTWQTLYYPLSNVVLIPYNSRNFRCEFTSFQFVILKTIENFQFSVSSKTCFRNRQKIEDFFGPQNKVLYGWGNISSYGIKNLWFLNGNSMFWKGVTERFQPIETPRNVNTTLNLLSNNHFEYVNIICPNCDSYNVNKQEFRERNPILGEFSSQTIYLRRYLCKDCGKKFITSLDSVIKPHHRYANIYTDKIEVLIQTGYRSLRKAAVNFQKS